MPVYLFSYHAYRSWMPDHPRGFTRRGEGYQGPDEEVAEQYRAEATGDGIVFDGALQRALIEEAQAACKLQGLRLHAGATEPSHIHCLVSWKTSKHWTRVRASLKSSLSRRLALEDKWSVDPDEAARRRNPRESDKGRWVLKLSRGGSRKHVGYRRHFDYLMVTYLPKHGGVGWYEDRGWVAARSPR